MSPIKVAPLLILLLAASPALAADPDEAFLTQITVGRTRALIDVAGQVLDGMPGGTANDAPDVVDPRTLYGSLYSGWLELETLRARACGDGALSGKVCATRFDAPWLRPPGVYRPTLAEVTAWSDELQEAAMAVTGPICDLAPRQPDGPGACSVE
jgi:hypothetical protein